eukprot:COSAG02_NODE_5402_length_4359_cov_2.035446_3_plen_202_part_00
MEEQSEHQTARPEVDGVVSVANPATLGYMDAAPAHPGETSLADLERALAGLQSQTVSPEEVVRVMDSYLGSNFQRSAGLDTTVRSIFAHLTVAPANWYANDICGRTDSTVSEHCCLLTHCSADRSPCGPVSFVQAPSHGLHAHNSSGGRQRAAGESCTHVYRRVLHGLLSMRDRGEMRSFTRVEISQALALTVDTMRLWIC